MTISLIPAPETLRESGESFLLDADTAIWCGPGTEDIARLLRADLTPATGLPLPIHTGTRSQERGLISLGLQSGTPPSGYTLEVTADTVRISGGDLAGLFHGTQTFRQLLPVNIFRRTAASSTVWQVPGVRITDRPRFGWRGMLFDVSRHFFGKNFVLKLIDVLALHHFNVLHLHLTDDQGWRIEIQRYPQLTEIGSTRPRSMLGRPGDGRPEACRYENTPHSGYFSQADAQEIVAYAARRFITVLPEVDLPGHSQAAIAAYPHLGNGSTHLEVGTDWGISSHILNTSDSTIEFYQNVLSEVMDLFPSPYIHIGGDECPKDEWRTSLEAQRRIAELGLAGEEELQSWFIRQMNDFLSQAGRRLVGWDEILEGGLPPATTVMSWQDEQGGITAASAGHDVIMAPQHKTYLYHHQSDNPAAEPPGVPPAVSLRTVYDYEPIPHVLHGKPEASHVLGAQCCMWTEHVVSHRQLEQMVFPRACAFAERVWFDHQGHLRRLHHSTDTPSHQT